MNEIIVNKKALSQTILIVAIVVVVVAVAGGAAAIYLTQNQAAEPNTSPTPTPQASTTPSDSTTPTPSSGTSADIATANSVKFSVSLTENGTTRTYTYQGKNAGSNSFMMRIDYTEGSDSTIFIFNEVQHKAWTYAGGAWVDISSYFDSQFTTWDNLWNSYITSLTAWTGSGDYSYTQGGQTIRIFDIQVNPTLADSLFEHS